MQKAPQENKDRPRPSRRRRLLTGCLVATLILAVVALTAWWIISRNLGDMLAGVVREQAGSAINGTLEFEKLEVDLAGRAILTNTRVIPENAADPVLSCPKAMVGFDLLNFIGPNRGRRAVAVTLHEPEIVLVREPDGGFNLAQLAKEGEGESDPVGVTVHLRDAVVDFTDWCLLDQNYPRIEAGDGLGRRVLDELGYDVLGTGEVRAHRETLQLSGNVVVNPERGELAYRIDIERSEGGGNARSRGTASLDGTQLNLNLDCRDIGLHSVAAYLQALFPTLAIGAVPEDPAELSPQAVPWMAGMVQNVELSLVNTQGQRATVQGRIELNDFSYHSASLPELNFKRLMADYSPDRQRLATDLELSLPGLTLTGKPALNLQSDELSGKLDLKITEIDGLARYLELSPPGINGDVSAGISLGGSLGAPAGIATLKSNSLHFRQLNLGRLTGSISYDGRRLELDGVEFKGGELPLIASGSLAADGQDGSVEVTTGELNCAAALAIANKLFPKSVPELDISGSFKATAFVNLAKGVPASNLHVTSRRLEISGQRLEGVEVKAGLDPPNIKIESATATYIGPELNLAGFASAGPLKVGLRAGGSVSTLPDQPEAALAIIGEGETRNLSPAQAKLSFKAIGPAGDPQLRLQVKTTHAAEPLVLSANGYYRQGYGPVEASLTWQDTQADFSGQVDIPGQRIKGKVTATDVNLRRFSGNEQVNGTVSAAADVGGTFSDPTVEGSLSAPQVAYATGQRTLAIVDLQAGFKLQPGNRIKVNDGSFLFSGNRFTVGGELGAGDSTMTLGCRDFNLFSALATVRETDPSGGKSAYLSPPVEIQSSGPLVISLRGELTDPEGTLTYQSGPGTVHGHAFSSAALEAGFNLDGAEVTKLEVTSNGGSVSAAGLLNFEPRRYSANATLEDFDIGVLTSLGGEVAAGLAGNLNGRLAVNGDDNGYSANGTLRLANGVFQGVAISTASAEIHTTGGKVGIRNGNIVAEGTIMTAQGSFDPTAADPLSTLSLSLDATSVDLALLEPFLSGFVKEIDGRMACQLDLTPSKGGYPNASFIADSAGGRIRIDSAEFESMSVRANMQNDILKLERYDFNTANSTLSASGRFDLGRIKAGRTVPLDLTLNSQDFRLNDLRPMLPVAIQAVLPGGTATCRNLRLTGNTDHPLLSGEVEFDLMDMPPQLDIMSRATGIVKFIDNEFDISEVRIVPTGSSGAEGHLTLRGSGLLSLIPMSLISGDISVQLDNNGNYIYVDTHSANSELLSNLDFAGWLGGTINVGGTGIGTSQERMKVWGNLAVNKPGGTSKVTVYQREAPEETAEPAIFMFDPSLTVTVNAGTKMHYQPMDIQGAFVGDIRADLGGSVKLSGIPGLTNPGDPRAFRISGDIQLPDGSVKVYRHIVRLDGGDSQLQFLGVPGQLLPVFNGRGSLTLRNVLTGGETSNTTTIEVPGMGSGGGAPAASNRDLKVFFTFTKFSLDAESEPGASSTALNGYSDLNGSGAGQGLRITSEPPLPEDQIIAYLLGGARDVLSGQTGLADFAQGELVAYGTSFISREIEELFDLSVFQVGGIGDDNNPFFIDMEKSLTPDFTVTYYRDYFSDSMQNEEFGIKYRLLEDHSGNRYQNLELEMNFQDNAFSGSGSEFMFIWTTSF